MLCASFTLTTGTIINLFIPGDVDVTIGLGHTSSSLSRSHESFGVGVPDAAQITSRLPVDFFTIYDLSGVAVKLGFFPEQQKRQNVVVLIIMYKKTSQSADLHHLMSIFPVVYNADLCHCMHRQSVYWKYTRFMKVTVPTCLFYLVGVFCIPHS